MKEIIMKTAAGKIQIKGLRKFTMDEIALELKVSKKTIYKYFPSKDDIIVEYFKEIIESDKEYTLEAVNKDCSLEAKMNSLIYSYHKYKLPVNVLDEAYKFYYEQWEKVQELKNFKLKLAEEILKQGVEAGVIKENINLRTVSLMLESISSTFLDYKFLSKNDMTIKGALKEVTEIMLHGVLK